MRRVVITGVGLVTPLGVGTKHVWDQLIDAQSGIRQIQSFDVSDLPAKIAGQVPRGETSSGAFNADDWVPPKDQRKMDEFIVFAMGAAQQAVSDSGWVPKDDESRERTGVMIGSGIGGLPGLTAGALPLPEKAPRRVSPFFIPANLLNLPSGHVSIRFRFSGPNHAVVTACSSGAHAIGDAARLIQWEDADVMVCGGTEAAVCRLGIAGFAAARALSTAFNDDPPRGSRPWDRDRDGFVMGEGAGILVLEEYEHAKQRGAKIYAEVIGYGMSGDAFHLTAPRCLACSYSSSTRMPAPSPITKPSRSRSHGREPRGGSSLNAVDSARAAANPAMPKRHTAASVPPHTMTSASSSMISRAASPIACAPVEQAVTTAWFGPLNPCRIETLPEARLIRFAGIKNGVSRRGPLSRSVNVPSAMPGRPPMPEPIMQPVRSSSSSSSGFQPASSTAMSAAAMAKMMNWSIRRWSFGGTQSSALKWPESLSPSGTWAAIRAGRSETSNDWIAPIPDSPASSFFHTRSTPRPSGVTSPIPVTTTRLMPVYPIAGKPPARSAVGLDKAHRVLDGYDLFRGVVRYLAAEFLLECHNQLDRVETVGPQIVDKARVFSHLRLIDAKVRDDDLLHSVGDVTHPCCPSVADLRVFSVQRGAGIRSGDQPFIRRHRGRDPDGPVRH